jgi:hypothetical protein
MVKHTAGQIEVREGAYIYAADGSYIAKTTGNIENYQGEETDKANARRFVLTWNVHDELVAACEQAADFFHNSSDGGICTEGKLCVYCAAIAKAKASA